VISVNLPFLVLCLRIGDITLLDNEMLNQVACEFDEADFAVLAILILTNLMPLVF
jgi:hypothetical protein